MDVTSNPTRMAKIAGAGFCESLVLHIWVRGALSLQVHQELRNYLVGWALLGTAFCLPRNIVTICYNPDTRRDRKPCEDGR